MNDAEKEIYDYANKLVNSSIQQFIPYMDWRNEHTERCIEVPWFACTLNKYNINSLLDIGFTFASHDYLRLLLDFSVRGHLEGMDIIDPEKVLSRYPEEWLSEIKNIDVHIMDSSEKCSGNKYDAVSIISTMEHIGFDEVALTAEDSAFERKKDKKDVKFVRDDRIEEKVLNNVAEMLENRGYCMITVPTGRGGQFLHRIVRGYGLHIGSMRKKV